MTGNKSTRYFSSAQEKSVAKSLNGTVVLNSGATKFYKGDVIIPRADVSIECKTVTAPRASISIKKDWIEKQRDENFAMGITNQAIAFNFEPEGDNYYIIDEKLMRYLMDKLEEDM